MQRYLVLLAAAGMLTLSGCFDIIEEIWVNKDGSGAYTYTIDMGEAKSMIEMLKTMAPDSTGAEADNGMGQVDEISKGFTTMIDQLKEVKGITGATEIKDTVNYKFGVKFSYANIAALNEAVRIVGGKEPVDKPSFISEKKKFVFTDAFETKSDLTKALLGEEEHNEDMEMAKSMFSETRLRKIYHFERPVKKVSNKASEISSDKKTVTLDYYLFRDEAKDQELKNEISF